MIKRLTKISCRAITAVVLAFSLVASPLPFLGETVEAYTRPGYNGKIAFQSSSDGNNEIYIMDADGGNPTRLTNNSATDRDPVWSSDGRIVAFNSFRDGNSEIYIMDADGGNQTRLAESISSDFGLNLSPDGSRIAFVSERDGNREIYTVSVHGGDPSRLTINAGFDDHVQWSPDGSKIAFRSYRESSWDIYTMNPDGSNQQKLTSAGGNWEPRWSPDGSKIAFSSYRDGYTELYMMNADGSNETNISMSQIGDDESYTLAWSPQGNKIAYSRYAPDWSSSTLVVVELDGSGEIIYDLSNHGVAVIDRVDWSPSGNLLLITGFTTDWSAKDLYALDAIHFNLTKLTNDGASGYASWLSIPNTPPATTNDTLIVSYQTPAVADVLANDSDEETLSGDNLSIYVQPTHGSASVVDGKVRYAPNAGFQGEDSLTYQICDSFMLDQKCATGMLNITIQAPSAPAINVGKVAGVNFNESTGSYTTSSSRPVFSGTASPGAEIKVEIHSDPIILATVTDENGNWSVTPSFDLPTGEHMVYISATLNGLTTELDSFELTILASLANTGMDMRLVAMLGAGTMLVGGGVLRRRRTTE